MKPVVLPALAVMPFAAFLSTATPAGAVAVIGHFTLDGPIDWAASDPVPAPLLLPPLATGPATGGFTYDTALVSSISGSPSGTAAGYTFTAPGAASMFLTVNGYTYTTTSSPANPLLIQVDGGDMHGNDVFRITALGNLPDPSNPLAALPMVSMLNGGISAFPDSNLPVSDFPRAAFQDPEMFLDSQAPRGPIGFYSIRFRLSSDISVTPVPEPPGLALLALAGALGIAVYRRRDARRVDRAATMAQESQPPRP